MSNNTISDESAVNLAKHDLQNMIKFDRIGGIAYKKHNIDQYHTSVRLISYYENQILSLINMFDCKISFESDDLNDPTDRQAYIKWLSAWSGFTSSHPIRIGVALIRNPYLSSTDKLVGATINTMLGFLFINATPTPTVFPLSLQIIARTNNLSIKQVKQSISHLKKHARYFDHSAHLKGGN